MIIFPDHTIFCLWNLVFQLSGKGIRITGVSMVKTGVPLWLSCFSNIPLMVRKVQFYTNDDLYITLNNDVYGCRSSAVNGLCEPDQCHCSEDGKTYSVKHQGFPMAGNVSLQCKIEFELALEMTDCIIVNAIGMFINRLTAAIYFLWQNNVISIKKIIICLKYIICMQYNVHIY